VGKLPIERLRNLDLRERDCEVEVVHSRVHLPSSFLAMLNYRAVK
jgi:hypothetical protein